LEPGAILTALAACGPKDRRVIDALITHLGPEHSRYVGSPAFAAIARLKVRKAVPVLEAITGEDHPLRKVQAHGTLLAIDGDIARHGAVLAAALGSKDENGLVASTAEVALRAAGKAALPSLRIVAKNGATATKRAAAKLVAHVGARRG
jgi:hypothetical protein